MIYNGYFISNHNDTLYKVKITTNGDTTQSQEITLGGNPFTTEMDDSDKTIYKPAKYQSATVELITPNYNFDIYSGTAQGTKVELYQGETIVTGKQIGRAHV